MYLDTISIALESLTRITYILNNVSCNDVVDKMLFQNKWFNDFILFNMFFIYPVAQNRHLFLKLIRLLLGIILFFI